MSEQTQPEASKSLTGILLLCVFVLLLSAVASATGVFARGDGRTGAVTSVRGETYEMVTDGVYRYNAERLTAEGVGWDIVTLFIALPALLITLPFLRQNSVRARLFAVGIVAYLFYQYLMYSVTWAFGPLFLLFVATYAASLAAIAWLLSTLSIRKLSDHFGTHFPYRGVGIFSIFVAVVLTAMWLGRIIPALQGEIEGVLLGQTTLVVQALDLGIIVPFALFTGFMSLRHRPVSLVLAPVFVVKGAALAAAITAMLVSAWIAEGTLDIVPFLFFLALLLISVWLGIRMYGPRSAA